LYSFHKEHPPQKKNYKLQAPQNLDPPLNITIRSVLNYWHNDRASHSTGLESSERLLWQPEISQSL